MEHTWQFFRAGGVDQVSIRSGEDICKLGQLDQKLWVALACPTRGIEFDPRTLDLIDSDHDGRIRPPELLAACRWACERLRDPGQLLRGGDTLSLDAIADNTEEGRLLIEEAGRILQLLDKQETRISLADVADRSRLLAAMRFNGDGIVTPATAEDDAARAAIQRIIDTHGSQADLSGEPGIDRARTEAFFTEARAIREWRDRVAGDPSIVPLGDATVDAVQAANAVQAKIDDFFARCRLAAYDPLAAPALNPTAEEYRQLYGEALTLGSDRIAHLPLAAVAPGRSLPLRSGLNPAWAQAMDTFRAQAAEPLLGAADALSEDDWRRLQAKLGPARDWLAAKPATKLDALAVTDVAALLDNGSEAAVLALLDADQQIEPHTARMADLEKLLRFQRDLAHLLDNFVSFKDFYRREGAIFQAGRLYLDARSCDLTVRVDDAGKHAALAGLAKAYLVYCDCTREGRKMTIVAAMTAGDVDFLFVGRNGVFYDRQGNDWDATIVKIIENPTSIGQAFFAPYKKFVRMIEEQVAKRAAASDTAAQGKLSALATNVATADQADPAAAAKPNPAKVDVGTVAAIGVALGSISTVLVALFGKFVDLGWWIPLAILGLVLAISGPSMLIAWLKLRQRSLGPILDASGWAINGRMKINVQLGGSLSRVARIPQDAKRNLRDPYADRHGKAWTVGIALVVVVLAGLAWRQGWLDTVLPERLRAAPPAATAPAPAAAPETAAPPAP
ncbi:hypothetical protein PIGHUM_01184 [Pigmentiphaga humi]|uniref:EF-hand domain-containing protein n=1 Tax=Pigmentiphaga humi TaxID=2478468 RepID=A0A3P4AYI5_9BURK|nr:hypothetical protein [Pigmentiphaga humi]VCU69124.1 hypothetical protein PIGHUM_01184 [Pigmentiphaga humi]